MNKPRGHIIERKTSDLPRLFVWLVGLAGLAAFITATAILFPQIRGLILQEEVANDNRTWLTAVWTQSDRTDADVTTLVEILSDNGIKKVYLATNRWHGQTGEYIELPYVQNFLQRFRKNTTAIPVYAWLIIEPDKLFDANARQQVIDFANRAVNDLGFDGIHLQAKSVPNNSQDFILLLRDLRAVLGPRGLLSITVPPDRRPLDPDVPISPIDNDDLTWSQEYKRRVILNANEIVLMGHTSALSTIDDYQRWLRYQVKTYAEIIEALEVETGYIVALPTYPAEFGHDPAVENPETAIAGVLNGITASGNAGDQIDGVGLYPWEETDLLELDMYWAEWVQRGK